MAPVMAKGQAFDIVLNAFDNSLNSLAVHLMFMSSWLALIRCLPVTGCSPHHLAFPGLGGIGAGGWVVLQEQSRCGRGFFPLLPAFPVLRHHALPTAYERQPLLCSLIRFRRLAPSSWDVSCRPFLEPEMSGGTRGLPSSSCPPPLQQECRPGVRQDVSVVPGPSGAGGQRGQPRGPLLPSGSRGGSVPSQNMGPRAFSPPCAQPRMADL